MYILNSYPVKTDDFRRTQPHRSQTRELRHHYAQVRYEELTGRACPAQGGPADDSVQVSDKLQLRYEREGGVWRLKAIENLTFRYTVGLAA